MKDKSVGLDRLEDLRFKGKESAVFAHLSAQVAQLCLNLGFKEQDTITTTLETLWLPVALNLATAQQKLNRTFIQGILGGQGTGKSTLCLILKLILNYLGFEVANLSLDDLYLTHAQRQELQLKNPRLIWRGPPGTHDIALGLKVIEQCLQGDSGTKISMPRFNKSAYEGSGDRLDSDSEEIAKPDILLFEGWFVGVQPVKEDCFERCPEPIITPEDRQFAQDSNQRLEAYLPLWDKLDNLIVLYLEDYRLSKQWRKDAEHQMIASGKEGMSDPEIDRFVEYFWQSLHPELFIKPLIKSADLVIEIKSDRTFTKTSTAARK
jgi:D-glycerate 3-kinase